MYLSPGDSQTVCPWDSVPPPIITFGFVVSGKENEGTVAIEVLVFSQEDVHTRSDSHCT